jgi:hypothetical protein
MNDTASLGNRNMTNTTLECVNKGLELINQCTKDSFDSYSENKKEWEQLPQETKDCTNKTDDKSDLFKFCTPEQKQANLKLICPPLLKYKECMKPIDTCLLSLDKAFRPVQEENPFDKYCASYNSDSQGLSSMMPWTLLLLLFV